MRTSTTSMGSPQKAQSPTKNLNFSMSMSINSPSRSMSKSMNASSGFSTSTHAMKCQSAGHQQKSVQFVCLARDCQQETRLACSKCLAGQHSIHSDSMIKISDIFENIDDSQIANWPLEDVGKTVKEYLFTESNRMSGLYKELDDFFFELDEQLRKRLEILKKNLMMDMNTFYLRGEGKQKMQFLTQLRKMYADAYDFTDLQMTIKQFFQREITPETFRTGLNSLLQDKSKALQQSKLKTFYSRNLNESANSETATIDKEGLKSIQKQLFDCLNRFKSCLSVTQIDPSALLEDMPTLPKLTNSNSAPNSSSGSQKNIDDWPSNYAKIIDFMNTQTQPLSDRDTLAFKKETYADGSKYVGFLLNGQRSSLGTRFYSDGSIYIGQWQRGAKVGNGTMHFRQGTVYQGEWLNDKRHGQGSEHYQNGSTFEGQYEDGVKCGLGKFVDITGKVFEGMYYQDKRHGIGRFTYKNNTVEQVYYVSGDKVPEEKYEEYLQGSYNNPIANPLKNSQRSFEQTTQYQDSPNATNSNGFSYNQASNNNNNVQSS